MAKLVPILEFAYSGPGLVVDRAAGTISGIKIVGLTSNNTHGIRQQNGALVEGTDYTLEALQQERQLLEGINVNIDHPPATEAAKVRSCNDRFAWLDNVNLRPDEGNFGRLNFLNPLEPLAVRMMNAAEKKPNAFVLSHNAMGQGEVVNRRWRVSSVPKVNSVDIVTDGGTNHSMLESRETPMTVKKKWKDTFVVASVLESLKAKAPKKAGRLTHGLKRLFEMGEYGDMPVDASPAVATEEADEEPQDWKSHLGEMLKAIIADEGMSADEKCKKIIGAVEELIREEDEGEGEEEAPAEESADDEATDKDKAAMDENDKDKKAAMKESRELRSEINKLKKDNLISAVLLESGVRTVTPIQRRALSAMATVEEMKELVGTFANKPGTTPTLPRSQEQGKAMTLKESKETTTEEAPTKILPNAAKIAAGLRNWN